MTDERAAFHHGLRLLSEGRYAEGWPLYENRERPDLWFPAWQGEDLTGRRLMVWLDQGLGDKIMFSRFVPRLQETAAEVILVCEPALARLFATNFATPVVAASGAVELPDADVWIMYGSLPLRLGITLETLPSAPYLRADRIEHRDGARIGVVTRGGAGNPQDANRSIPPDLAGRLLSIPGAISLHYDDLGVGDFLDTAAVIAGLDLVISVDTAVAHLAGAMGKPVWILLPAAGVDWRWLHGRSDSPWYPSARVYRQPRPGDWSAVIDRVRRDAGC
jgi:hypothetical protein